MGERSTGARRRTGAPRGDVPGLRPERDAPGGRARERRLARRTGRPELPRARASFFVQKHWARRLHYDLRLEIAGRLVSFALPKGPSLDPSVHRIALRTADHEIGFGRFEGVIPEGEYGEGVVMLWDYGTYEPLPPSATSEEEWLERGHLKLKLRGERLQGLWRLVHIRPGSPPPQTWLLVKSQDRYAVRDWNLEAHAGSVVSGRSYLDLRQLEGGRTTGLRRAGTLEEYDVSRVPREPRKAPST